MRAIFLRDSSQRCVHKLHSLHIHVYKTYAWACHYPTSVCPSTPQLQREKRDRSNTTSGMNDGLVQPPPPPLSNELFCPKKITV